MEKYKEDIVDEILKEEGSSEWQAGIAAFNDGKGVFDCPYAFNSISGSAWFKGFVHSAHLINNSRVFTNNNTDIGVAALKSLHGLTRTVDERCQYVKGAIFAARYLAK